MILKKKKFSVPLIAVRISSNVLFSIMSIDHPVTSIETAAALKFFKRESPRIKSKTPPLTAFRVKRVKREANMDDSESIEEKSNKFI